MTNIDVRDVLDVRTPPARSDALPEPEGGLAALRGDCARMVPHWAAPGEDLPGRVAPSRIHGVSVPPSSARLIDAMAGFGD